MRKKKKWNKIIYCTGIILLGSSMALSLFACGKKDDETAVEQAVSQEETQNTGAGGAFRAESSIGYHKDKKIDIGCFL